MISLMMNLSWKLTFLVLMETPVTGLIQNIYDTHYQRLTLAMQSSMASANEAVTEVVYSIRVARSFNAERHEARRYGVRLRDIQVLRNRRDIVRAVYLLVRRLTGLVMQVLMLYYGRLFIQSGQMTTGNLLSFILYQSNLGDNIRTLAYIAGDMLNSVGAAGKVFDYLDRKPQVSTDGKLKPDRLMGHVSFNRLSFAYPGKPNKTVLQDFSLELKPGQMTALDGEILLDNKPLKSYDHRYLHEKVAVVSQDPVLFSGSIRDNIAYGLAGCSLDEIQEAACQANAHDFIKLLAKGYDTEVGEGGGQLSKSEKQRIAVARALVRKPQVLILDEITSSLDTDNQNKVLQALTERPNQTKLVIAHKLETVKRADQIAVIGGGKVEERGTHQQLMDLRGRYYQLVERHFAEGNSTRAENGLTD
ncbi:unnamed protein product [Pleuronectes platessa]|uniref:Uncharacterized protein n=1 Tax=Pleuronectes platessa TaxID=8262 RepID=A0A9N7TLB1_PLEPL|nr:unnamed protein product [Pleuronectes platessa]